VKWLGDRTTLLVVWGGKGCCGFKGGKLKKQGRGQTAPHSECGTEGKANQGSTDMHKLARTVEKDKVVQAVGYWDLMKRRL